MKLSKVILATIGVMLLCFMLAGISHWYLGRREEAEIRDILAELKAKHVPTCGEDLKPSLADKDNAWIDLKPFLYTKHKENGSSIEFRIYDGETTEKILLVAQPRHRKVLQKYLERYRSKCQRVAEILAAKPKLRMPWNHKRGFNNGFDGIALRVYCQNACLSALEHAMGHETDAAIDDLVLARTIANQLYESSDFPDLQIAGDISDAIVTTCAKIVELDPNSYRIPHELRRRSGLRSPVCQQMMLTQFVDSVETARFLDDPKADKTDPIWPMSMFVSYRDYEAPPRFGDEGESVTDVKHTVKPGDYVPKSKAYRRRLLRTLQRWKPFLISVQDHGSNYTPGLPQLDLVWGATSESDYDYDPYGYDDYGNGRRYATVGNVNSKQVLMMLHRPETVDWSIDLIEYLGRQRATTGKFPSSLPGQFNNAYQFPDFGGLKYLTTGKTCYVVSKARDDSSVPYVRFGIPSSKVFAKNAVSEGLQLLYDYQKGHINRNGQVK